MEKPQKNAPTPLQRLFRLTHLHRRTLNLVLFYAVFIGLLNLTLPLGIQAILGQIAGGSISASWAVLVLAIVFGLIFIGILKYLQISATEHLQRQLMTDSALEFAVRIPHLQLEKLRKEHLPELVNRFFDTLTIQKGLPKIVIDGSAAILQMLISLVVLSFYHTVFLTFSVIVLVFLGLILWSSFLPGLESSLKESKYKYKIAFWLEEVGRVAATFKLAGQHETPVRRTDELLVGYLDARKKHFRVLVFQFFSSLFLRVAVIGGFLVAGGILVMENSLNLGQFVAAEILVIFVADSLEKIILLNSTVYDVLTSTEKIGQFTDLSLEKSEGIDLKEICSDKKLTVEWRNLSHQFDDRDQPTLKNLDFKIEAGEKIALVGYNSSGRSTLMQINSGLIQEFTGNLLFNNLPVKSLDINILRENIGDISSQEDIFKGTLLENILLGRDIPLAKTMEICDGVGLSVFFQNESQGLNFELLPGGKNLPGSVVAKILLARAIVSTPSFLVLEDPLQKLNARERLKISKLLTDPKNAWTVLVSTDDPMLAALCDRVLVLKNGEIVASGAFSEIRKTPHFEWVLKTQPEE